MKKTIDWICIISIISSTMCVIDLFANGIENHGLIRIRPVFGIFPWPMEWLLLNIPILMFGTVWLLIRYGLLINQKAPFLFGKTAFAILGVALLTVELARLFYHK